MKFYNKSDIKILLCEPLCPRKVTYGIFSKGAGNNTFSYGLANIASYAIKNGYTNISFLEPQIERMDYLKFADFIKNGNFDVVGITTSSATADYAFYTINLIKKILPSCITILGGIHATLLPCESLNECVGLDIVVIGEGELTFIDILNSIFSNQNSPEFKTITGISYRKNDAIHINDKRAVIDNLDTLPLPAYHLFPMNKYRAQITFAKTWPTYTILASRGCVFNCSFCNATEVHGRRVRYKSPEKVADEIMLLKDKYNAKGISFMDSTFTIKKDWVYDFCDVLSDKDIKIPWMCNSRTDTIDKDLARRMKEANCWGLSFGIESGNQNSLDLVNKQTTVEGNSETVKLALELGLFVYATYIICLPGENEKDALNTIKYAIRLGNHSSMFYLPVPFPKTRLYESCKDDGGLRKDYEQYLNNLFNGESVKDLTFKWSDLNSWNFNNPAYINPRIGSKKMLKIYNTAYKKFFRNPKVLYRNFREVKSIDGVKKYFYAARSLFGI